MANGGDLNQRAQAQVQALEEQLTSTIGRKVAALTALAAPIIAIACAWIQDKVGIDLDPAAVTGVVTSTVVGITGAGATWLYNRGGFEKQAQRVVAFYLSGQDILKPDDTQP
jgi:hypothetical protein